MKIALTNDDGIDAPGIDALLAACDGLGTCEIFAPDRPFSGVGHRVTTHAPIRVEPDSPGRFRVFGTPADCTRIALCELAKNADWLLAGINHGANLGSDSYISGTVAAVREAALLGKSAIAVSQYVGRNRQIDWSLTSRRAARVIRILMDAGPSLTHYWSVNLPHPETDEVDLEIVRCELDPSPLAVRFRQEDDSSWVFDGDYHRRPRIAGRDVDVCFGGRIAVTRLPLDLQESGRS